MTNIRASRDFALLAFEAGIRVGNAFISTALAWQAQKSVFGILLNALFELLRHLMPIGKLVQSVKKLW
jgi:hypothetical protein